MVKTGDGFLIITEAQPAGKRVMSGLDLINGSYARLGDKLVPPAKNE